MKVIDYVKKNLGPWTDDKTMRKIASRIERGKPVGNLVMKQMVGESDEHYTAIVERCNLAMTKENINAID